MALFCHPFLFFIYLIKYLHYFFYISRAVVCVICRDSEGVILVGAYVTSAIPRPVRQQATQSQHMISCHHIAT
uniref:Putative secreted protein n=1 Tax=Amblyomma cajennense TaxID=34607 RepID=A0A023FDD8_AMBCJ